MTIKIILVLVGFLMFYRASTLAQGKKLKKFFVFESFLFWQKFLAIYFTAVSIYYLAIGDKYFYWFFWSNLIIDGLFYLQPTPRTSQKLLIGYIILNFITLLVIIS